MIVQPRFSVVTVVIPMACIAKKVNGYWPRT